jgi:hypothetical protein
MAESSTAPVSLAGRLLAVLLLGVVIDRWRLLQILASPADSSALVLLVTLSWLGLLLASVVGLLGARRWGPVSLLLLVLVSTVFHGIPLVPGVSRLLPAAVRPGSVFILNLVVAAAAVLLLRSVQGRPSAPVAGAS